MTEIQLVRKVLDANERMAAQNRQLFAAKGLFVMNLMSSPGSGKTATLERTLVEIAGEIPSAVVVGDICTTNDADRLARTGAPVVQINTDQFGGDCHLTAHMVAEALPKLDLSEARLLVVENVGNLVCPAEFDIGEDIRCVVLSVTEGEDKPLKYPLMFRVCDVALLNKIDLISHLDFDREAAIANIHAIDESMPIFEVSARTGEGFAPWLKWLKDKVKSKLDVARG